MGEDDDRELMLQVSGGSRSAFTLLVERYETRLIAYFHRQCGDRDLSEDCAQEVFVRLYRSRDRYGPQAKFSTYLFTIARNYWIDVARSRRARPMENTGAAPARGSEEDRDLTLRIVTEERGPVEHAERGEEIDRLRRALSRLPTGQQDVVMLGVLENLPYADVAAVLGIPIGTVKSRVHAAVQSLRAYLETPERTDRTEPDGERPSR